MGKFFFHGAGRGVAGRPKIKGTGRGGAGKGSKSAGRGTHCISQLTSKTED